MAAIYVAGTNVTLLEALGGKPADAYYNLLVRGFRSHQLSLDRPAPAALARLADPYDPAASAAERMPPFGVHDLSYYQGKLYLYFGVTPALLLFWPYALLTGRYLYHDTAVLLFCLAGFLGAAGILGACWRRYFPGVPGWIAAAAVLGLGLATTAPILLRRAEIWEVPVSCAYALLTLALGAAWLALHRPAQAARWLAAASAALGLAVGARPAALFGVVILLIPLRAAVRERPAGRRARLWLAALLPVAACGVALAWYNTLRFHDPLEFGQRFQLAGDRQDAGRHFSLRYLPYNLRMYFLHPIHWSRSYPWVELAAPPPAPAGHAAPEDPYGILPDIPFALLALAAPLAWRGRAEPFARFGAVVGLAAAAAAAPLLLFYGNCSRYEMEFLPPLLLLAALGVFGLEQALAARRGWRRLVRLGWVLLLAGSIGFNLLAGADRLARVRYQTANTQVHFGRLAEAETEFEAAIRAKPSAAAPHNNLGSVRVQLGRLPEALVEYETAARLYPGSSDIRYNLGNLLSALGRRPEAIAQYQEALRIQPDFAEARLNLGVAFAGAGQPTLAAEQFALAARGLPASAPLFNDWGMALAQAGRYPEAEARFTEALRLRPDYAEARYGLGSVLAQTGRYREARAQVIEALRLRPDLPRARQTLDQVDVLLAREGSR